MNYCKDCLYWKPDLSTAKTKSGPMYGKCQHPQCLTGGYFHDHRQRRDGTERMDWTARHTNDRYRCQKACSTRFVKRRLYELH